MLVLLDLLTLALKECRHQLVLPWGFRHDQLIGPKLAGKDVMLFGFSSASSRPLDGFALLIEHQ